jgi:hypothetical protein
MTGTSDSDGPPCSSAAPATVSTRLLASAQASNSSTVISRFAARLAMNLLLDV